MDNPAKPYKPNPIKRRLACPDCGFIYQRDGGDEAPAERYVVKAAVKTPNTYSLKDKDVPIGVRCPQCAVYTPWADFWSLNYAKWGWTTLDSEVED